MAYNPRTSEWFDLEQLPNLASKQSLSIENITKKDVFEQNIEFISSQVAFLGRLIETIDIKCTEVASVERVVLFLHKLVVLSKKVEVNYRSASYEVKSYLDERASEFTRTSVTLKNPSMLVDQRFRRDTPYDLLALHPAAQNHLTKN